MRPGSVDLVVIDPPYGVTAHAWDRPVELERLWCALERAAKPTATFLWFGVAPLTYEIVRHRPGLWRDELVWVKSRRTRLRSTPWKPVREHETILVFHGPNAVYNRHARARRTPRADRQPTGNGGTLYAQKPPSDTVVEGAFEQPSTVLAYESVFNGIHPTEKPMGLLKELIQRHSNPGDLVLDPLAGSASTLEAAFWTGRGSIGFELDGRFHRAAAERLAALPL